MDTKTTPIQALGSNAGAPNFSNHQAHGYAADPESTLAPIVATTYTGGPEFTDSKGARQLYGFVKSHLYALKDEGKIKSVCIRKRGAARGKRLWCCASIRAFLHSQMEGGSI